VGEYVGRESLLLLLAFSAFNRSCARRKSSCGVGFLRGSEAALGEIEGAYESSLELVSRRIDAPALFGWFDAESSSPPG
jgi:hypothetical protein